jgi:molybdopterin synthase catalytic subunit
MEVRVLVFGPMAASLERREVVVRVADGASCGEVLRALAEQEPKLADAARTGRLAVNHEFAGPERAVHSGDEVALIAMVSGG